MRQKGFVGLGAIKNLGKILKKHKPSKIFLVCGKNSYEKSGAKNAIEPFLKNFKVVRFNNFQENPKLNDIMKGIQIFRKEGCDFVIAVGGGSAIDIAKSIKLVAANSWQTDDFIKGKEIIKNKGEILVAIPTTSGTGSEATKFAVIYIGKTKYSIDHDFVLPDYLIVDPNFTMSLNKEITACTGMDALSQSVESYWSINSTKKSKDYAKRAIKLIVKNLTNSVNKPSKKTRLAMAIAANLAGKAINISKTTACHSVSYPITSYFNVPHGHAVALTLGRMLVYNSKVTQNDNLDKRGVSYVKKITGEISNLIGAGNAEDAASIIKSLMKKIGLTTRLSELGIKTEKDIGVIVKNGFNPSRVKNNPRKLTEYALRNILEEIR